MLCATFCKQARNREASEKITAEASRREAEAQRKLAVMQQMIEAAEHAREEAIRQVCARVRACVHMACRIHFMRELTYFYCMQAEEAAEQKRAEQETALTQARLERKEKEEEEADARVQLEALRAQIAERNQEEEQSKEDRAQATDKMAAMQAKLDATIREKEYGAISFWCRAFECAVFSHGRNDNRHRLTLSYCAAAEAVAKTEAAQKQLETQRADEMASAMTQAQTQIEEEAQRRVEKMQRKLEVRHLRSPLAQSRIQSLPECMHAPWWLLCDLSRGNAA